jgi:hypothetical protein
MESIAAMPGCRHLIGAARIARLRYLCAWRTWKYEPHYRHAATNERVVSFAEPLRLWWRGELDRYVGRPLLSGSEHARSASSRYAQPCGPQMTPPRK